MTTNEIRKRFLAFFEKKGHTIIESDSLVPKDDPTVLFTTAGMQQFKKQFLGYTDEYTRAATSQKCLRTDDLEKVGKTAVHHTFFEMLGNFSFGDYFKQEAIEWAWEFFTEVLKLPADKLWASVYKDDDEAEKIWKKLGKGFDPKHLVKLGDHDNFWPADAKEKGPNGPCGPCSEIFFDFGVNKDCKNKKCDPTCACGRFAEIWNLVFTQFNRKDGGVLEPLPNKNIDTGMGLERLASVLQGKKSNFEIDIFVHIIASIKKLVAKISETDERIVADHIRAIVFGINDGVIPSNEGRGYVIKKLIIAASDIASRYGKSEAVVFKLVPAVVETMGEAYPEIKKRANDIASTIKSVEESFIKVRKERIPELKRRVEENPQQLGQLMFEYRDTYGLTLSTIIETASAVVSKKDIEKASVDYERLMEDQKNRSRAASKMTGDVFADVLTDLGVPKTKFLGYDHAHSTSTILKILNGTENVNEAKKGETIKIFLDKTPFYAESGGQVGDTGTIAKDKNVVRITDTQKFEDIYIHHGIVESGTIHVTDQVDAQIDIERRQSIMRNHTATHLLQAALREVLGPHVKQQGSLVAEDRLRFDFAHPKAITPDQIEQIELDVNTMVLANDELIKEFLDIEEAKNSGALAFFAEKYGKIVRVVTIGTRSKEFCGGTHVDATGEIGLFKITSESAIAQGIRRIEAKTGLGAIRFVNDEEAQLNKMADILRSPKHELVTRLEAQANRIKKIEKDLAHFRFEIIRQSLDEILNKAQTLNGSKIVAHSFDDVEMENLRRISDLIKQKSRSAVIVLGAKTTESASVLVSVSDDLIKKGIKANEIIAQIAPIIGGKGGGKPELAQAGSRDASKVEAALQAADRLIKERMT